MTDFSTAYGHEGLSSSAARSADGGRGPNARRGQFDEDALAGVKVMIVEDEAVVSMMIEQMLEDFGCEVTDMACRLPAAVRLAETTDAEVAVLDMNLAGDPIDAVVEVLERRGVPFLFATGYGRHDLRPAWSSRPVLAKPFRLEQLRAALLEALAG